MIWWPSQQIWMNMNPEGCFRNICSNMVSGNCVSMWLITEENTENLCWQKWSHYLLNAGTYWLLASSWAKNNCHFPLVASYYCDNNVSFYVYVCMLDFEFVAMRAGVRARLFVHSLQSTAHPIVGTGRSVNRKVEHVCWYEIPLCCESVHSVDEISDLFTARTGGENSWCAY
jgi:hypothetical protein